MSKLTRLREALGQSQWEAAQALVEANPELVAKTDGSGRGLVGFAAKDGRWEQARWLLERGGPWLDALTGMMEATDAGASDEVLARELWERAQSMPVMPRSGNDPLLALALRSESFKWAQRVLARGWWMSPADWDACWHVALSRHGPAGGQALLEGSGADSLNEALQGLACARAFEGDTASLSWLSSRGADWDLPDREGRLPLCAAARGRRVEAARWLLGAGAGVDVRDGQGRTALWHAVVRGDEASVDALMEAGANPEARQGPRKQGDSPLRLAIKSNAGPVRQAMARALESRALSQAAPVAQGKKASRL